MAGSIEVRQLSKRYRRYHRDRPVTLQQTVLSGWRHTRVTDSFWALRDVSFAVAPGHMLGVLGANGAGKSTLLRLVGGVGKPDEGIVVIAGRIGALLSLGAGFHADLTGRENLFINGVISGLTRRQVAQRFDAIVSFAELEEFIDSPLRTYSAGMWMRLAFSVAIHVDPEVLLVDEVLAVGDIGFQRKCRQRIEELRALGCATLLVSHDTDLIAEICDDAIWLDAGQVIAQGPAAAVVHRYTVSTQP